MHYRVLTIAAAAALAAGAAPANDSTAEKVAGGLVLTRTNAIDMVSEDLYVSPERVRVAYVFRNRTRAPVRTTVAFPMPDRDLAEMRESDIAYPHSFQTLVDGRPVTMRVERRAMLAGVDHTALLSGLGIPVGDDPDEDRLTAALARLRPADRARVVGLGLAEEDDRRLQPALDGEGDLLLGADLSPPAATSTSGTIMFPAPAAPSPSRSASRNSATPPKGGGSSSFIAPTGISWPRSTG